MQIFVTTTEGKLATWRRGNMNETREHTAHAAIHAASAAHSTGKPHSKNALWISCATRRPADHKAHPKTSLVQRPCPGGKHLKQRGIHKGCKFRIESIIVNVSKGKKVVVDLIVRTVCKAPSFPLLAIPSVSSLPAVALKCAGGTRSLMLASWGQVQAGQARPTRLGSDLHFCYSLRTGFPPPDQIRSK